MLTEFEAKFYPVVKAEIREKLRNIGAVLDHEERLMRRTIYGQKSNPRMDVDYIRVRDEGDCIRLSAKIHAKNDGKLSDQKETDIVVSSYDDCLDILKHAGLEVTKYQETKRETWKFRDSEVVIDTWPELETYIEIEGPDEAEIKSIAELLGFDWETRRITSVVSIYAEVYNLTIEEVNKRIASIDFESRVFTKD